MSFCYPHLYGDPCKQGYNAADNAPKCIISLKKAHQKAADAHFIQTIEGIKEDVKLITIPSVNAFCGEQEMRMNGGARSEC